MLSVDDLVDQVVQALDKGKHLENTYIIFSSDNGFHLGKYDDTHNKIQIVITHKLLLLVWEGVIILCCNHTSKA